MLREFLLNLACRLSCVLIASACFCFSSICIWLGIEQDDFLNTGVAWGVGAGVLLLGLYFVGTLAVSFLPESTNEIY